MATDKKSQWTPEQVSDIAAHAVSIYLKLREGRYREYDPQFVAGQAFAEAEVFFKAQQAFAGGIQIPAIVDRTKSTVTAPNLKPNHPISLYIAAGEPGNEYWKEHSNLDPAVLAQAS